MSLSVDALAYTAQVAGDDKPKTTQNTQQEEITVIDVDNSDKSNTDTFERTTVDEPDEPVTGSDAQTSGVSVSYDPVNNFTVRVNENTNEYVAENDDQTLTMTVTEYTEVDNIGHQSLETPLTTVETDATPMISSGVAVGAEYTHDITEDGSVAFAASAEGNAAIATQVIHPGTSDAPNPYHQTVLAGKFSGKATAGLQFNPTSTDRVDTYLFIQDNTVVGTAMNPFLPSDKLFSNTAVTGGGIKYTKDFGAGRVSVGAEAGYAGSYSLAKGQANGLYVGTTVTVSLFH